MSEIAAPAQAADFSLSDDDLTAIGTVLPQLRGRWNLVTESGDEGELYARLLPPWGNSRYSAFLLERDKGLIILTDNLSDLHRCGVSSHPTAVSAMGAILDIVENTQAGLPA